MRISLMAALALACVATPAAASFDYLWCDEADAVRLEIDGATVTIVHEAALYNCCPDPVQYDVSFGDATLQVVETVPIAAPCDCDCCYELGVEIPDAPPGPWQVLFRWFDLEQGDWVDWHGEIEVPDLGQGGLPGELIRLSSGCLDTSDVTTPPTDVWTWGAVKAGYR